MQSIFDLKTSTDQLESSNYGVSKDLYEQIAPTRDVTLANFANGSINFKWQTGGTKWWIPSRTYLRFRVSLTKANGIITNNIVDDIAPIMNQCSALFQSAEFRLNQKTISRVADYLPQIDTLNTRLNKSNAWIDSVGNSTNWWQESFQIRQENVSANGEITNDSTSEAGREELGYDIGTHTLQVVEATGVLTFALGGSAVALPPVTIYEPGDIIRVPVGAGSVELRVVRVDGLPAQTIIVQGAYVDIPAVPYAFVRVSVKDKENQARRVSNYEITWTPPLSIFNVEHAIPCGSFELILNPATSAVYKKAVVETSTSDATPGVDFDFNVQNLYCYINTVEGSRVDNLTYYLDLKQMACQAESGLTNAFSQKNFDVSPSTNQLVLAFQDTRAGTNTMFSPTKFRSYDALPTDDQTQKLNRMFISYCGVSKPQIDADCEYVDTVLGTGNSVRDFTTQRYVESILNSGSYHDTGGSETLQEWQNRGQYYLFNWSKDGNDRSTRVSVHTGFPSGAGGAVLTNARLLLFSISSQVAKVVIQNGAVTDCQIEDV